MFLCVVVGLKRLRQTLSKLNVSDVWSPAATIVGIMHLKWERWERRSLSVVTRVYTPTLKSRAFRFHGKSAHNTVSPERLSWLFWAQKQSAFISTQQKLKRLSKHHYSQYGYHCHKNTHTLCTCCLQTASHSMLPIARVSNYDQRTDWCLRSTRP